MEWVGGIGWYWYWLVWSGVQWGEDGATPRSPALRQNHCSALGEEILGKTRRERYCVCGQVTSSSVLQHSWFSHTFIAPYTSELSRWWIFLLLCRSRGSRTVGLTNDANYASICLQIYAKNSFVFAGIPHNLQAFHYLYSGVAKKSEEKVDL